MGAVQNRHGRNDVGAPDGDILQLLRPGGQGVGDGSGIAGAAAQVDLLAALTRAAACWAEMVLARIPPVKPGSPGHLLQVHPVQQGLQVVQKLGGVPTVRGGVGDVHGARASGLVFSNLSIGDAGNRLGCPRDRGGITGKS